MTSEEEHRKIIRELIEDLNEKIRSDLIVQRQKIVGFSTSEISCNLLELFLHRNNLVSPGFKVNHRFFTSEKSAIKKLGFDFPEKNTLISFLISQEKYRTLLCYGRNKDRETVEESIKTMQSIKKAIEKEMGESI